MVGLRLGTCDALVVGSWCLSPRAAGFILALFSCKADVPTPVSANFWSSSRTVLPIAAGETAEVHDFGGVRFRAAADHSVSADGPGQGTSLGPPFSFGPRRLDEESAASDRGGPSTPGGRIESPGSVPELAARFRIGGPEVDFRLLSFACTGFTLIVIVFYMFCGRIREAVLSQDRGGRLGHALLVIVVCLIFMIVGPALMVLNKHIMQDLDFPYPLSLAGLGVLTATIYSQFAVRVGFASIRPESLEAVSGRNWFFSALPIGACKATTLATGNAVYLFLGLGFIQMLKAFTPAVVLLVMWLLDAPRVSDAAKGFVFVIVFGTVVVVRGELHLTVTGLVLMLVSEVMEAVNLVLTQRLLQELKFSITEGLYFLGPPSAWCLFLAAAVLEWPNMLRLGHLSVVSEYPLKFFAAATLGLIVNYVGFYLIQLTSSLLCKILNTVRGICLVFLGVIVYGEDCSILKLTGYTIALVGFAGYTYVQMNPKEGDRLETFCWQSSCCCRSRRDVDLAEKKIANSVY